jgi:hypothetical protein
MGEMTFVPSTLTYGYHLFKDMHVSDKLTAILTKYYPNGNWASRERSFKLEHIETVPQAIFYCACKITSKTGHHAAATAAETGGALAGVIAGSVLPGIGTAVGAAVGGGIGILGTYTARGVKKFYKLCKGSLHRHRGDAAEILAQRSVHPLTMVRDNLDNDDKAAIEAVIVLIGKNEFSSYMHDKNMLHTLIYNNIYSW